MSSNDFFRIKKGLNIRPSDPADNTNPEVGDIIVDSTDSNRVKVFNSDTQAFQEVGGGVNLVSDWESFTPTINNFTTGNATVGAKYRRVGDSVDLKYSIILGSTSSITGGLSVNLPSGLTVDSEKLASGNGAYTGQVRVQDISTGILHHAVALLGIGSSVLEIRAIQNSSGTVINNNDVTSTFPFTFTTGDIIIVEAYNIPIQGWSSATDAVVRKLDLNKETVNEINIRSTSSSITSTDFGETSDYSVGPSGSNITLNFSSLGLTEIPVIQALGFHHSGVSIQGAAAIASTTTTSTASIFFVNENNVTFQPEEIMWSIKKQGADVNRSATIVGVFENINSSDLVVVRASGNDGTGITANTTPINFTEVEDNQNSWDGSRFTAPKDGVYIFNGKVRVTGTISALKMFINGSDDGFIGHEGNTSDMVQFTATRRMSTGDYAEIVSDTTATLNNLPLAHSLEIVQLPDTESIIKNLNDNNNFVSQTKILNSSSTTIGDKITFNNLEIGKKYEFYVQVSGVSGFDAVLRNGPTNVGRVRSDSGGCFTAKSRFVATSDTAIMYQNNVNQIFGDGLITTTYAELTELPDNTILDSNKFD